MGLHKGHSNYHKQHFDITEERLKEAYKLGALGLTLDEIARFWDLPHTTFIRYVRNNAELKAQIKKGKDEADLTVIQALLQQAREGNVIAAIFWLKNRQPDKWKDRREIEGKGFVSETKIVIIKNDKDGNKIQVDPQTDTSLRISN